MLLMSLRCSTGVQHPGIANLRICSSENKKRYRELILERAARLGLSLRRLVSITMIEIESDVCR